MSITTEHTAPSVVVGYDYRPQPPDVEPRTLDNPAFFKAVCDCAFQYLWSMLCAPNRGGNVPSHDLARAHELVIATALSMVRGDAEHPRVAVNLAPGTGKTTTLAAIIRALDVYDLLGETASVAVCCATVEALIDMYRELRMLGVDADKLGLSHSYRHDPDNLDPESQKPNYVVLPDDPEAVSKPVVLMTQARLRGDDTGAFRMFNERPRSLTLWDEACVLASATSVSWPALQSAHGAVNVLLREANPNGKAVRFLDYAMSTMGAEVAAQKAGAEAQALTLGGHDLEAVEVELVTFAQTFKGRGVDVSSEVARLADFLRMAANEIRILQHGAGERATEAVIRYKRQIPRDLKNLLIMDGSVTIDRLSQLNSGIHILPLPSGLKRYDNVIVHLAAKGAGRSQLQADMREGGPKLFAKAAVEVVSGAMNAHHLIVCHKHRSRDGRDAVDFEAAFRRALEAGGCKPDEVIEVEQLDGSMKAAPRVSMTTWGKHKSSNKWSHVSSVLILGVPFRREDDLRAAMAGEIDDIRYTATSEEFEETQSSKVAAELVQAMNRGRMRRIIERNQAPPMSVWLFMDPRSTFRDFLAEDTVGMQWRPWHPAGVSAPTKTQQCFTEIAEFLGKLDDPAPISTRALKIALGSDRFSVDVWKEALRMTAADPAAPRRQEGRSWVMR